MCDDWQDNWAVAGYTFGHRIYIDKDEFDIREDGNKYFHNWRFLDGTLLNDKNCRTLVCPKCKGVPTKEGHDPCIANLPGVKFACCGHSKENPYVSFDDGRTVRDEEAVREIEKLRKLKMIEEL